MDPRWPKPFLIIANTANPRESFALAPRGFPALCLQSHEVSLVLGADSLPRNVNYSMLGSVGSLLCRLSQFLD